jgi:hypothetical protein
MVDVILEGILAIQSDLDDRSEELHKKMHIPRPSARARIKKAWRLGCILCKQQGTRDLYFANKQLYVVCRDCYIDKKIEVGERNLKRSIARRLAVRARTSASRA